MSETKGKCQVCSKAADSRCSSCRSVFYCSREHQKQDWPKHKAACTKKKYKQETNETLGRHLVATEEIKPDFLIFKDKPIILGPKVDQISAEIKEDVCLGCYTSFTFDEKPATKVPCPHCTLPLCSTSCSQHYFHREFECRLIRESKIQSASLSAIRSDILLNLLYLRCLLLPPESKAKFYDCESNCAKRTDNLHLDKTFETYEHLKKILFNINHPDYLEVEKNQVHKILGIIETNASEIKTSANVELTGLFPHFSIMEHHCCPNVKYYFVPASTKPHFLDVYVRAATKLKKGDHLAISYTNILWSTEKRREHLKRNKYFACSCSRCIDPTEFSTNFSTILCPSCKKNYALPEIKPDTELQWKCSGCSKIAESWAVKRMDLRLAELVTRTASSISSCKEILAKLEKLAHPQYYLAFVVNHSLIQLYGRDPISIKNKILMEEKLKICNELLNTIKKLDPGLARLSIYAAVIYFEMHSAILALAGGETDEDFHVLRRNLEAVHLARLYLNRCVECFEYELFDLPENKLKTLAVKKMEYLNLVLKHGGKNRK